MDLCVLLPQSEQSADERRTFMATTKIDRAGEPHTEVTTTEARQGIQVGLIWVLGISLALAVAAGVAMGFGWITLPW
jgi:hypothetical protein